MNKKQIMENFFVNQIVNYPILYLYSDINKSLLNVYNQIYFVVGNGFEWKDGLPIGEFNDKGNVEIKEYNNIDIDELLTELLYFISVDDIDFIRFTSKTFDTKDFINHSYEKYSNDHILYFKDMNFVNDVIENSETTPFDNTKSIIRWNDKLVVNPYPIDHYSMINQMAFSHVIWDQINLYYAKIILDYAIKFYSNSDLYKNHVYFRKTTDFESWRLNELEKIKELKQKLFV